MKNMKPVVLRMRSFIATGVAITALAVGFFVIAPIPARSQAPASQAQGFTFALIGDLGYTPEEEPWVDNVLADLNRSTSLAFVVHAGDLSSPQFGCTNELWARRLAQFHASAHPFVYTPAITNGPTATSRPSKGPIRWSGSPGCARCFSKATGPSASGRSR